ncbi:hypothetical protein ACH5RR_039607 [Cinchona calisaya]|uniref:non-specific serine/threonine protein kinase n=1 Tax=Cinchona calisaya TaxID=153742 RepID=A0ABD2Y274_9GENT
MNVQSFHLSILMRFFINISILQFSVIIPFTYCAPGDRTCPGLLYNCGSLQGIGYPFWGGSRPEDCGIRELQLQCVENQYTITMVNNIQKVLVLGIDKSLYQMSIVRYDLWQNICLTSFINTTSIPTVVPFLFGSVILHIFYGCPIPTEVTGSSQIQSSNVTCTIDGMSSGVRFSLASGYQDSAEGCNISIGAPILNTSYDKLIDGLMTLKEAVRRGFIVDYSPVAEACSKCENSGGSCGSFWSNGNQLRCMCQGSTSHPEVCPKGSASKSRKIVGLAIGISAAGIGIIVCLVMWYYKIIRAPHGWILLPFNKTSKDNMNLEAAIKQYGSLAPKRFTYYDIKKMTNSFKDKLGKGGYGDVYKGKLFDNRLVAVKILNSSKGSGEEFINEVASISRTSHVNVVSLLGFCLDAQRRALIYEFMPNGSLERYIHGKGETTSKTNNHLGWEKLYDIALGIARGLEYLHKGCSMRILHFDIKPHNILLDEDFCPKISDFGLAKLCTRKESVVSMLEPRGTIGYIAPEVTSRNFGSVSHKSDVYSYGMMLLEMAGGRKNVSVEVTNASEIYFPHWVYQHILLDKDFKLLDEMNTNEDEIARKMMLVGLWCIQTDPSHRPAMNKVIEMLEGSSQALEIPPKPFFGSPSRSPQGSSTRVVVSQYNSSLDSFSSSSQML